MRLGLIFDPHVSDQNPSTRKDKYRQAILNKLEFIIETANNREYAAILIAGDLFHKKIPSHNSHLLVSSLISIFEKSKAPVFCIAGNHDISGNLVNLYQQPLYVLVKSGVVSLLENTKPFLLKEDDFTVSVNGAPFLAARDKKDAAPEYMLNHLEVDCKIGVFHQMILPDGMKFFSDYINIGDLIPVNSDIIVDGHYHVGFNPPVVEQGGKYFINGGSLSRGSSEAFNQEKEPCYIELQLSKKIDGGFMLDYDKVVVPHDPAQKIFDMLAIERRKESQEIKEFIKNLSEFEVENLSSYTPEGIMRVLVTMGMPEKYANLSEEYLVKAYERVG